jgi:hypothetical protein
MKNPSKNRGELNQNQLQPQVFSTAWGMNRFEAEALSQY